MSDRNDILSKGWNENRRIGMNIVTFAMVFAMVLVTLGGLGCIDGDESGTDANTNDGGSTDSAADSQTNNLDKTDTSIKTENIDSAKTSLIKTTTTDTTANQVYEMTTGALAIPILDSRLKNVYFDPKSIELYGTADVDLPDGGYMLKIGNAGGHIIVTNKRGIIFFGNSLEAIRKSIERSGENSIRFEHI